MSEYRHTFHNFILCPYIANWKYNLIKFFKIKCRVRARQAKSVFLKKVEKRQAKSVFLLKNLTMSVFVSLNA